MHDMTVLQKLILNLIILNLDFKLVASSGDVETILAPLNSSVPDLPPCQENFFRPEGSLACVPSCHTWSAFPPSVTISTDVFIALSAIIGLVTGVAVVVLSVFRHKQM